NSERTFSIQGRTFSHIVDPRTGWPVAQTLSATVLAESAATADVLATICSVLSPDESVLLVESIPRAACLIVTANGQRHASASWPGERLSALPSFPGETVASVQPAGVATSTTESRSRETGHEMVVDFEIRRSEDDRRYRRPYVAVWVEDKDGYPVKTLSLFLMTNDPGPRWHRDLRRWYSDEQVRNLAEGSDLIATVSKPTRNPGKYSVNWDGRDNAGKLIAPGEYTLLIEAAREHGTYQLMKHKFQFGGKSFEETLKGNVEIGSAKVKYEQRGN
ncbi:MAG: DUF2271 domain-containing protein, partial [Planctomycetales bacterium]|nr:DUF2271 domain-containing protein [Planctomycetales bacterium]